MAVKVQSTIEPYNDSYKVVDAKHVGAKVGEVGGSLEDALEFAVRQLADILNRVSELEQGGGSGGNITVDSELSLESENPVQNKVVTQEFKAFNEAIGDTNRRVSALESGGVGGGGSVGGGTGGGVSSWNDLTDKPFGENADGTVKQLDNKYLEILESLKDVNELLPSTTGTTQYDGNFGVYAISVLTTEEINNYWHVVNGMEIEGNVIVEFDGEAYSCAPQRIASLGNIVAIGNCTVWGGTNNGEPFVITIMNFKSANGNIEPYFVVAALTDTAPTQHTARVYQKMPERYVIKNEYLPFDAIAAYIDNYIDEALGGDY